MRSLPPTTRESAEERSSMDIDTQRKLTLAVQLHAQEKTLRLIIVVYGPESVLPDVLAMHTIEMIPKSMILSSTCLTRLDVVKLLWWNASAWFIIKIISVTHKFI